MNSFTPDFGALEGLIAEKSEKFDAFLRLLLEYNARFNLTSIVDEREVHVKHFLDSLAGAGCFPVGAHAVEVGSGAGFPSIPLMLAREDLSFTLVESTGKKCEFLRVAIGELGLNAEVVNARAEDVGRDPAHREKYDVCCARAVARLNTLAEYCMPLVKKGGKFVAYKGVEDELTEGRKALTLLGGGKTEMVSYELTEGFGARTLIVTEKLKPTPPKFPRGNGAERKRPIV